MLAIRTHFLALLILPIFSAISTGVKAEEAIHQQERHIFDFANLLPDDQEWLEKDLQKENVDIVVVTIPSLEGSLAKKYSHAVNKVWDTKKKTGGTIAIILSAGEGTLEVTRTVDLEKQFDWTNIQSEADVSITSSQTPSEILITALDIIRNNSITPVDPYDGDTTEPLDQKPDPTQPNIERPFPFPPLEDEGKMERVHFQPEGQRI